VKPGGNERSRGSSEERVKVSPDVSVPSKNENAKNSLPISSGAQAKTFESQVKAGGLATRKLPGGPGTEKITPFSGAPVYVRSTE
jgi:hypothetical protein